MTEPCLPCNQQSTEKSYLMVEVTASSANDCGNPSSTPSAISDCPKQEPTYDKIDSSFIVPEPGMDISVQVCNNTIYIINQFLEFIGYDGLRMRITTISSDKKTMTLQNGCANGAYIINNPLAGIAVSINSQFIVVDTPSCTTADDADEALKQGLSTATALCTPNLEQPVNDTVVYQIVGRTESDPSDTALQKCIKRVKNFFFSLGAPRCPAITELVESDNFNYREVRANKADGQFKVRKLIGEHSGTVAGSKYIMAGTQSAEKAIGPAFVYSPFDEVLQIGAVGSLTNVASYATVLDGATASVNYAITSSQITGLLNKNMQDHYYLNVHIMVMLDVDGAAPQRFLTVKINEVTVAIVTARKSGGSSGNSEIVFPVKVLTNDSTINIKVIAIEDCTYSYSAQALGAFI